METVKQSLWRRLSLALYKRLDLIGDQRLLIGENGPPVRNAPAPLPALLRFVRSRLKSKSKTPSGSTVQAFRQRVNQAVSQMGDAVKACNWVEVPAGLAQWQTTGIHMPAGSELTLLAQGMLYISKPLDVGIGPSVGLWYRIGQGAINKLPRDATVIRADEAGELEFMAALPGEFSDPAGSFETSVPRKPMSGEYTVAVIAWQLSTAHGLSIASRQDQALFQPVMQAYEAPVKPPQGWRYLWRIGEGEVFRTCEHDDGNALCCHTHGDVGILQYPLDHAFSADLTLRWSWLMEQLPSALPEHIQPTHDYMSIAVEFDNGLDLTYFWSAELPVDTIFQCPLPWWDQRETHWVLRSGRQGLGEWQSEERNLYADYQRAISGPLPERVVAVWLIANSAFQRGQGDCRYRSISVSSNGSTTMVQG